MSKLTTPNHVFHNFCIVQCPLKTDPSISEGPNKTLISKSILGERFSDYNAQFGQRLDWKEDTFQVRCKG